MSDFNYEEWKKNVSKALKDNKKSNHTTTSLDALERIIETFYDKESEDIKTVRKNLRVLEIIKKKGIKLIIPNNDLSNEHIDIQIFTNTLSKDELELIKKELKL